MCGLIGVLYTKEFNGINELVESLIYEAAIRGTDATGIAYNSGKGLCIDKKPVSGYKFKTKLPKGAKAVIGHTRHTTQGNQNKNYNNHPFPGKCGKTKFALAHNGVLMNDNELKNSLPRTKIETDSYVAVQLLEKSDKLDFKNIKKMAETVYGSFSFSILDQYNNLYIVKGDSPISILYFDKYGLYVYASTDEILWKGIIDSPLFEELQHGRYGEIKIKDGDILKISAKGKLEYDRFDYTSGTFYDWRTYTSDMYDTFDKDSAEYDNLYYYDLISVAASKGISSGEIDELISYGLTYDEIEDYLYS